MIGDKNSNNNITLCMERVSTKYNMLLPIDRLHKINGGGKKYPIAFVVIRPTSLISMDKTQKKINVPLERG